MKDLTFRFYFIMVRYNNTIALLGSGCYVLCDLSFDRRIHLVGHLLLFSSHRNPLQQVPNSKSRTMKSVGNGRIKKRMKTNNIK